MIGNTLTTALYAAQDGDAVVYCGGINMSLNQPAAASGSMTSEHLDHYEEGTFEPVISDGTDNAVMHAVTLGYYTKIGDTVHISMYLLVTDLTDAGTGEEVNGNIRITGLPFTALNATGNNAAFVLGMAGGLAITAGTNVSGYTSANSTEITLLTWDVAAGTSPMQGSEWSNDGEGIGSLTYKAA